MTSKRRGVVLVLSAPSGTGKSTLVARLREEFPDFAYSVSCTTRAPRQGERDGADYHFLSREEFIRRRDACEFAEWAEVHGNFYGTPLAPVRALLAEGRDLLFDVDVQGAALLRESLDEGAWVFIFPPSRQALVERLAGRGKDTPEVIELRLRNAKAEIDKAPAFDYWIVNDDLEEAYRDLRSVYLAERCRPGSRPGLLQALQDTWPAEDKA